VAKRKGQKLRKTTDLALVIAMRALVKIASGADSPFVVAQTALGEIGDPKDLLGHSDCWAPLKVDADPIFASEIADERKRREESK
jgi:hypothetical protein